MYHFKISASSCVCWTDQHHSQTQETLRQSLNKSVHQPDILVLQKGNPLTVRVYYYGDSVVLFHFYSKKSFIQSSIITMIYTLMGAQHSPAPFACTTLSGIRSRSKWAISSVKTTSWTSRGPLGPAVCRFSLSPMGCPPPVVSVSGLYCRENPCKICILGQISAL